MPAPLSPAIRFHPDKFSSFLLSATLILMMLPIAGLANRQQSDAQSQSSIKAQFVLPDHPIERELKGGERHFYQVKLSAGEFLDAIVEQRGIDVEVLVVGPDGKEIYQVDSPVSSAGPEPVYLIAESNGDYRIEVRSGEKLTPTGKYQLNIKAIRAADQRDREQISGYQQYREAEKLQTAGKAEAIAGYQQAAEIFHQTGTQLMEAYALFNIAIIYDNKSNYLQAKSLRERGLMILENLLGTDNPALASTISDLASDYQVTTNYKEAESRYQRAISIIEQAYGPEFIDLQIYLNNLAVMYNNIGDYEKAEPLYLRSLTMRERAFGKEDVRVAKTLNNLAETYRATGDYTRAEPLFQRALAIYQRAGIENGSTTAALSNLALLCENKGDYNRAEELLQKALTIAEKVLGKEHYNTSVTINNLADLYRMKGDYDKAEPLFQRSILIIEKLFGNEHPLIATKLGNLAELYRAKGDYDKAEALFQKALSISEKLVGTDQATLANILNNLARLYNDKRDYDKAEPLFQRALAISEKTFGASHGNIAIPLNFLANLYRARGEIKQAIIYQTRANEAREQELRRNLISGSESSKLIYLNFIAGEKDYNLSLHLQSAIDNPAAAAMAFEEVLRRKGRALDAISETISKLRHNTRPEDQRLFSDLTNYRAALSTIAQKGPGKDGIENYRAKLSALQESCDKVEAELAARSSEFRNQFPAITMQNVQKAIPENGVLVEYIIYSVVNAQTRQFGNTHYAVYLLNHDGELRWLDLGDTQIINSAIAEFRRTLIKPTGQPLSSIAHKLKPAARALDKLIMQPVRRLIGEKDRLLISPDGALNLLPFDALVDEAQHYLIENYQISYLTSGRDLIRLENRQASEQPPLIFADPDYGTGDGPVLAGREYPPLQRLTATADEAELISTTLNHAQIQSGIQATKQALKAAVSPQILHIATHGYFLNDSEVYAAGDQSRSLGLPSINIDLEKLRLSNPLLRSYLFFAGANKDHHSDNNNPSKVSASDQTDNGIMTALEMTGLNLTGTKLVVLSACDTGLGEIKNGDGVYGLRRALVLAGAETQLISLWAVDDAATKDLMIGYYKLLQQGESRNSALRKVQLALLTGRRSTTEPSTARQRHSSSRLLNYRRAHQHPYYWASFIQSGEWANLAGER